MSDQSMNAAILEAAGRWIGTKEYPGAASNEAVEQFWAGAGMPKQADDVPWCAAFVGGVLGELGLPGTGKPNARSYLDWGRKVAMQDAMPGDVVVFWRGSPSGWQGHVAFLVAFHGDKAIVRGGNQSDQVSDTGYPVSRILGIRRADASLPDTGRATVRPGDRGAMVLDLQSQLKGLGYFSGKLDGIFGPLTRGAVVAFQAASGLGADGVVGPKTWAALASAAPLPARDVSEADLRKSGSRTIGNADVVAGTAGIGGVVAAIDVGNQVGAAVSSAQSWIGAVQEIVTNNWQALVLIGGVLVLWWAARNIKRARVEDAVTGANLKR